MERWLPVAGYEGRYEVSDLGRVRSLQRKGAPLAEPIILRSQRAGKDYRSNGLFDGEKFTNHYVHRLVLTAFVGPAPDGMEGAHLDGVRTHNALANLQWVTRVENMGHKVGHGTALRGEACPKAKLTAEQVAAARERWVPGSRANSSHVLAREFGVSQGSMRSILRGRSWAHIPLPDRAPSDANFYSMAGEDNPNVRISPEDVQAIRDEVRRIRAAGDVFGIQALANRMGLARSHIESVAYGKTWKHLPGVVERGSAS